MALSSQALPSTALGLGSRLSLFRTSTICTRHLLGGNGVSRATAGERRCFNLVARGASSASASFPSQLAPNPLPRDDSHTDVTYNLGVDALLPKVCFAPRAGDAATVSLDDPFFMSHLREAASSSGILFLDSLPVSAPFGAIRRVFDRVYSSSELIARLNQVYPHRGVFKDAALTGAPGVDQKVPFDLSVARLSALLASGDEELLEALGPDFAEVVEFYSATQGAVISPLIEQCGTVMGTDLRENHGQQNFNFRVIDYFPDPVVSPEATLRCAAHRDYGTLTLLFQDDTGGLEYLCPSSSEWVPVPSSVEAVLLFGWCATILSNGRVVSPVHRVQPRSSRRNSAVFFVAPDAGAPLEPVVSPGEDCVFKKEAVDGLTVGKFKSVIAPLWRYREGTLREGHVQAGLSQEEVVKAFLFGD